MIKYFIIPLILFILLIFIFYLYIIEKWEKKKRPLYTKVKICYIFFMISFIISMALFVNDLTNVSDITSELDISTRIKKISQDISNLSNELSLIQIELENRIELVENLKKEAEIAENVINLSSEQVDAIQAKLNQELNSSGNKTLAQSILISGTFFILGIITPYTITFFKRKVTEHNEPDGENILLDKYSNEEIEQAIRLLDALKNREG